MEIVAELFDCMVNDSFTVWNEKAPCLVQGAYFIKSQCSALASGFRLFEIALITFLDLFRSVVVNNHNAVFYVPIFRELLTNIRRA